MRQRIEDFKELYEYRVVNVKNMKNSTFVTLEGACQSSFSSSFHSADTLTYHRKEWIQYPSWKALQNKFAHARSAFECALNMDP
jgi:crooked neck